MRRAGGWILGFCIVAAMAGGGWMAFRKILARETLYVEVTRGTRDPSSDAMISGIRFALDEAGNRAGGYRIIVAESGGLVSSPLRITISNLNLIEGDLAANRNYHVAGRGPIQVLSSPKTQGSSAATWAVETGARRMVVLFDPVQHGSGVDAWLQSGEIARGFIEEAGRLKPPVLQSLETLMDREALVDRILGLRPDFVFYGGEEAPYSRAFEIFDALRKKGYRGRLMTGEADPEVSYLAVPTRIVDGTYLVSPIGLPAPAFAAAYEPATGRHAGPHAWPGYLTMKALLRVIDTAGSIQSDDLNRALVQVGPKPRPCALYVAREGKFAFLQDLK